MEKLLLVTGCGGKKRGSPTEAFKLYRSSRIKAVYNRRENCDMAILSAEYGLVFVDEVIAPYERVMDEKRSNELLPQIISTITDYDAVVLFKGGTKKIYADCLSKACSLSKKNLYQVGYANMGDINKLNDLIKNLSNNYNLCTGYVEKSKQ